MRRDITYIFFWKCESSRKIGAESMRIDHFIDMKRWGFVEKLSQLVYSFALLNDCPLLGSKFKPDLNLTG